MEWPQAPARPTRPTADSSDEGWRPVVPIPKVDLEKLKEELASDPRFRGKDGADGAPGRDGEDGKSVELDEATIGTIADRVCERLDLDAKLKAVACKCEPHETPTQPADEQHVVVVADQNSPYWQRLSAQVQKTKETYHGLRVAPLPSFPIGQHPQAVVYKNSVPVRVVKGQYEVEALLSRLARGEPI